MSLAILHDHRAINIATVILVTISGLYAYSGLLGRPGGLLRQLLVGIPYGAIVGISTYYFDVAANNILSNTFRELVQSPAIVMSPITISIVAFVGGLTFPLLSPNLFRMESERQKLSILTIVLSFLFSVVSGTLWNSLGIQALFQLISPWLGFHPPLFGVIAAACVLSAITFLYSSTKLGLLRPSNDTAPDESPRPSNDTAPDKSPSLSQSCKTCIISLVFLIPAITLWIYFVSAIGWRSLVYFVILFVAGGFIFLIQLGADHLKKQHLQVISLVLFVLAAVLQLYQATAL